jgi:predicted acyltransferase (DUF342 family)
MSRGEEKMKQYEKMLKRTILPTTRVSGSGKVKVEGIGEVHISGSGYVSPEEIKISGSGRLPGGIKVGRLKCSGSISVDGDVEAEEMHFSGSAVIAGNVTAKRLKASGSFSAEGGAKGDLLVFSGSCRILGGVESNDTLRAHGSLRVLGDINARHRVELHGRFVVDGKIVTREFEAELGRWESHIKSGLEAINVEVKKREFEGIVIFGIPVFGIFSKGKGRISTTDIIAKGRVFIENVTCNNVTGRDVIIGEDCEIKGKVKYSGEVSIHPKARLTNPPEKIEEKVL